MESLHRNLEKYAELTVHMGVNVQKGQTLVINAPLDAVDFVHMIARKAYQAGAKNVHVEWNDDELALLKYTFAPDEAFAEYPLWHAAGMVEMAKEGACFLTIYAPNPDLLQDVDSERMAAANKTKALALKDYRSYLMANKARWSIIAFPSKEWAQKVFPECNSADEAVAKLWEVIFTVMRVHDDDPLQLWQAHNAKLAETSAHLNRKQYKQLVYNGPGTNLTIDLPIHHIWHGGAAVCDKGISFNPNMPTEEVFTMPHCKGVNGMVSSTKPLNYSGNVIDRFQLTFKEGIVTDFSAETGYETLKHLLDTDEGARRLGEVALVPYQSPISLTNLIFYNTLFDENASSHVALGKAYPINLVRGEEMSVDELSLHGGNSSLVHVDFMIGSEKMNIDGITQDGLREPIMRNGDWAIIKG